MAHGGTSDAATGELVWDGVVYPPRVEADLCDLSPASAAARGSTDCDMDPDKFLARLCALAPPPGFHMFRDCGAYAHHHLRARIIPMLRTRLRVITLRRVPESGECSRESGPPEQRMQRVATSSRDPASPSTQVAYVQSRSLPSAAPPPRAQPWNAAIARALARRRRPTSRAATTLTANPMRGASPAPDRGAQEGVRRLSGRISVQTSLM